MNCRRNILCAVLLAVMLLLGGRAEVHAARQTDSLATVIGIVQQEVPSAGRNVFLPVGGCVIQIFFEKEGQLDSLYTISGQDRGRFSFRNLPPQRVLMRLQCLGYEPRSGVYDLGPGENAFYFTMKEASEELSAASVSAETQLMKKLNDTTIFNTQAIRSLPGDGLKDVLGQIPGFSVTDNSVSVDGVKVSRTYVNGILVFGDNPMNAVNALNADEVTQVKVYDEQSAIDKHRGKLNSRKERVLDVITRQNFVSLSRASGAVAGGADGGVRGRYGLAGGANYDAEMLNIEAAVFASNYNNSSGLASGANISDFMETSREPLTSYLRRESLNLYGMKHWKSRTFGNSLSVSYDLSHKYNSSDAVTRTDYFGQGSQPPQASVDSVLSTSSAYEHIFQIDSYLLDTPLKSFSLSLGTIVTHGTTGNYNHDIWRTGDVITKERNETSGDKNLGYRIEGGFVWTNNDIVKWRPQVNLWGSYSRDKADSWTIDTLATSFQKRHLTCDGIGNGITGGVTAGVSNSVINDRKRTLDIRMYGTVSYSYKKDRKLTLDEWEVSIPVMDLANSYDYTYNEVLSSAAVALSYSNRKKIDVSADLSVNDKLLLNDERIPQDSDVRKNYLFPSYSLTVSGPKFRITSSSQNITPSSEQIRNRVSDSNPMVLTAGNSELKQANRFDFGAQYRTGSFYGKKGAPSSASCSIDASVEASPLVNRSFIFTEDTRLDKWDGYLAKAGAMLYTWENTVRPAWHVGTSGKYDTRIFRNKVGLKLNLALSYSQNPMYMGNELVWLGDWHGSSGIILIYNPSRKIDIHSNMTIGYTQSIDDKLTTRSSRIEVRERFSVKWMILPRLRWENTYTFWAYESLRGAGLDNMSHVLNTCLSTALFKDASLELSLSCNDLLNSPADYSTQTNALYMTQIWRKTYGRYVIFCIKYTFRKKK